MCGWFSSDGRRPRWICGRGRFGADKAGDLTPGPETWTSHFFSCKMGIMPPALRALPFAYSLMLLGRYEVVKKMNMNMTT